MTITDEALDRALRASDPASAPLTAREQRAADDLLADILAIGTALAAPAPTPIRRRRTLRWLTPVAAAGTAGAVLFWPHGDDGMAFASWTATASPASAAMATEAGEACRDSLADSLTHSGGETPPTGADGYRVVVTEVRGTWVLTALSAPDGSTYNCRAATTSPGKVTAATGGISTAQSKPVPDLGARDFTAQDGGSYEDNHGTTAQAQGQVGSQVVGVTIHADGHTTTATLRDGYFAAWWPITTGAAPGAVRYDLTLSNGQVLHNHKPRS